VSFGLLKGYMKMARPLSSVLVAISLSVFLVPLAHTDDWQHLPDGPGARVCYTAVFTGTDIIVWGGRRQSEWLADGGLFNLASGSWRPTSSLYAPAGRWFHAAVWTGTEMIIWGGTADGFTELADGARYNPATDTWTPLSTSPLAPRWEPTAVWTGSEMIVFGGAQVDNYLGDEYWVSLGDGARYDPATDTWTTLSQIDASSSRTAHTAVWTGSSMIVWGGRFLPDYTFLGSGAAYDPISDSWTALPFVGAPRARMYHRAVWTGTEMIVWGGMTHETGEETSTGTRYNPINGQWTPTTLVGAPAGRYDSRTDLGVWTGNAMFVYGGWDYPAEFNDAFLYYPGNGTSPCDHVDAIKEISRYLPLTKVPSQARATLLGHLKSAKACMDSNRFGRACHHLQNFQRATTVQFARRYPTKARLLRQAAGDLIKHLQHH
jgi:hypothetical protein